MIRRMGMANFSGLMAEVTKVTGCMASNMARACI